MIRKQPKRKRIEKYVFSFNISEIRKQNLSFGISYSETVSGEIFTDILHYSEIEKPHGKNIEVLKIYIIHKDQVKKELPKLEAEKLIKLLDYHNAKNRFYET